MMSKSILGLLWLVFLGLWIKVLRQVTLAAVVSSLELLLIIAITYALLLGMWINHNIAIYRAKGPRTGKRMLGPDLAHDYLGVPVSVEVNLETAQEIVIEFVNGAKCYRSAVAVPSHDLEALISGVEKANGPLTAPEVDV